MSNCNWYCYLPQTEEILNKTQINLKNSDIRSVESQYLKYCMDKNKFREFIESVGILKKYKPKYGVEAVPNPALGDVEFTGLKPVKRPCMLNCGNEVIDQVVERRLVFTPVRHWRTRCATCQSFVHPNGVDIIKGAHLTQATFVKHLKPRE
jgi:hypothetical protein